MIDDKKYSENILEIKVILYNINKIICRLYFKPLQFKMFFVVI